MPKAVEKKQGLGKIPVALLIIELITAILSVYLLYKLLGFNFDLKTRVLSFTPGLDPVMVLFFVLAAGLLVVLHFAVKKKQPVLFEIQELAKATIKGKAIEKAGLVKTDTRALALLLVEFSFVFMVVMAFVAWLDPEVEIVPWGVAGIGPPLSTILNGVVALIIVVFFYYLYSFTAWYRKK